MEELKSLLDEWETLTKKELLWRKVEEKNADKNYVNKMIRDSLFYYCL